VSTGRTTGIHDGGLVSVEIEEIINVQKVSKLMPLGSSRVSEDDRNEGRRDRALLSAAGRSNGKIICRC
jgi:hypothetical protein